MQDGRKISAVIAMLIGFPLLVTSIIFAVNRPDYLPIEIMGIIISVLLVACGLACYTDCACVQGNHSRTSHPAPRIKTNDPSHHHSSRSHDISYIEYGHGYHMSGVFDHGNDHTESGGCDNAGGSGGFSSFSGGDNGGYSGGDSGGGGCD